MGYIEDQRIARFHREAPLNSIWEGTASIMSLDVMRTMKWNPNSLDAYELTQCKDDFEPHARRMLSMMAKAMQGSLLLRQSIPEVAEAFCASRLGGEWAHEYGTLKMKGTTLKKIVDRAAIK